MHVDHPPTKTQLLTMLLGLITFGVLLPAGGLFLLHMEYAELSTVLETQPPFFTQSKGIAVMFAMPLLSAFMLALLGLLSFRLIVGYDYVISEKQQHRFNACVGSLILIALGVMVVSPFISNAYWGIQLRDAGYHRCPNAFMITSKWTQFVWVQDPEFCHLRMVRHMIKSTDHSREDLRAYLRDLQEEKG